MNKTLTAIAMLLTASAAQAEDTITIEFAYPYSHLFDVTYEKILPKFKEQHPNIDVKMRATYESYEDGTNTILREAVAGTLPDVTMQGLNRQAILVEKGIAKPLEPFILKEEDFAKDGYHDAMLALGTFNDDIYGLPFSVSLPVGYYNMDVMAKAGITSMDQLPKTWDEVVEVCGKLHEAGVRNPMFWGWNITGNWFLQALMWSQDKATMEGNAIQISSAEGLKSFETMKNLFRGCDMQNIEWKAALASFSAGEIGMMFWSTSALGAVERAKGEFELKTNEFPGLEASGPKGLPAGGNAAMLVSTSEDPKVLNAAWKWLKFITSGEGAADVARTTGYMPPNKAANEVILADFYKQNPNKETAVRQLPLLRDWQAYPGDNGLAITQVIYDGIEGIVTGEYEDMGELQQELSEEVEDLLPSGS
ncbi:extracellular solute-binding protein [Roseibium album]|uniref:sn-glycerol-3-phosphate-binding periplasmic protein UgpB n=1 Tax=Roseibium album TaxID=311410 RepID=A0A0M6Z8H8_9HYPH|nr:extracellular solute-binding protein [Roseibium album]MBG6142834.1 multiple sugar transport system substrate-binding protein [Labrenzia sp. EL_142]CTQ59085.1 sn-glycerol-3-phosphate-binding periplasmic protein UgpB precursor [Roseibium album]CTQ64142.1 sn-glycerol-3-phosphate-binding periplasmic protein UgpB precursor [Roseibium album]CTQ73854.1 sn-glycerol-3-phosphate-binding periplasmic protein UgpB precursor [Roseibium album]